MKFRNSAVLVLTMLFLVPALMTAQQPKFSEGTLLVVNKSAATVSIMSLETGETVATLGAGVGPHEVAVSPDGKTAVVTNYMERPNSTLTVIDLEKRRPVKTIRIDGFTAPHGIVYMPDGERVICTAERSHAIVIANIKEGKVEKGIWTGDLQCHMVAVTPDGSKAFGASIRSGAVAVIDMEQRRMIKTIETGRGAEGIAVTPDGKEVWVTNRAAHTISIIDTETLEITRSFTAEKYPIRVVFTPDGSRAIVSNTESGDVTVWDTKTYKEVHRIPMKLTAVEDVEGRLFNQFGASPAPVGILITPDGSHAFVANTRADIVTVIDLKSWKIIDRLVPGREPDGMAFSQISLK